MGLHQGYRPLDATLVSVSDQAEEGRGEERMVTHIDILFYIYLYLFIFIYIYLYLFIFILLLFIYLNTYLPILVLYHYIISSQKILANDLLRLFLLHFAPPFSFSFSFSSVTLGLVRKLFRVGKDT